MCHHVDVILREVVLLCRMHWAMYNPQEDSLKEGLPSEICRTLRKRNYLIEKAKNANIIGAFL